MFDCILPLCIICNCVGIGTSMYFVRWFDIWVRDVDWSCSRSILYSKVLYYQSIWSNNIALRLHTDSLVGACFCLLDHPANRLTHIRISCGRTFSLKHLPILTPERKSISRFVETGLTDEFIRTFHKDLLYLVSPNEAFGSMNYTSFTPSRSLCI